MLVLLPPSEGKSAASGRGRPVDLGSLSFPEFAAARGRVMVALAEVSAGPDGADVLGLGPSQAGDLERNTRLREIAARPAGQVYTGVLYEALDIDSLGPAGRSWIARTAVVFSGLWGAVRLRDRIPPYRCPVGVTLPGLGGLAAYWRREMGVAISAAAGDRLVIDLRSGAYAAMWPLPPSGVAIRVLHERTVGGVTTRGVVSHFNKATKGRIVRDMALAGARPKTAKQLVTALRDLKYTVEEARPGQLDVVVTEL